MDLNQIKQIFKNRNKIWEGLKNNLFKQEHIEEIAQERLSICRSNICGYHDPNGTSERAVAKGHESCAACGCKLDWKTRSLASNCGLEAVDKTPLWFALVSEQDGEMIEHQAKKNNE